MAQIIGQQEQQSALKEIKAALKEMEHTNLFLEHKNQNDKYTITFQAVDGVRCRAVAHAENRSEIDRLVLHHKQLVSEYVQKLAATYRISLDLEEKVTLGLELTPEEQAVLDAHILAELENSEHNSTQPQPDYVADSPNVPSEED